MQATNSNKKSLNTQTSVPGDRPMAPEVREVFNQIESMASEGAGIEEVIYKIMSQGVDTTVMSSALEHLGFTPDAVVDLLQRVELMEKEMLAQQQAEAQAQQPQQVEQAMMPQPPMGEQQMSPEQLDMMAQEAGQQLMQSEAMPSMAYGGSGNRGLGPFLGRPNDIARPLYLPPLPRRGNVLGAAFLLDDAAGQLFGNADRNKDGLMDGTFKDWNAKMARYKGKQNLNKTFEVDYGTLDPSNYVVNFNDFAEGRIRTKDQYVKDLSDRSALNFNPETNKYSGYFASNDLESRMIGKNQKDKNAIALSQFMENVGNLEDYEKDFIRGAMKYESGLGLMREDDNYSTYWEEGKTPEEIENLRRGYRDIMLGQSEFRYGGLTKAQDGNKEKSVVSLRPSDPEYANYYNRLGKDVVLADPTGQTAGHIFLDEVEIVEDRLPSNIFTKAKYLGNKATDVFEEVTKPFNFIPSIIDSSKKRKEQRDAEKKAAEEILQKYVAGIDDLDVSKYGIRVRQYPYGYKEMPPGHIEAGIYNKETGELIESIDSTDPDNPFKGYVNRWPLAGNKPLKNLSQKELEELNVRWADLDLSENQIRDFLKTAQVFKPTEKGYAHKKNKQNIGDLPISYGDENTYDFLTSNCADGVARAFGLCEEPNETGGITDPLRLMDNIYSSYAPYITASGGTRVDKGDGLEVLYDQLRNQGVTAVFGTDLPRAAKRSALNIIENLDEDDINQLRDDFKKSGSWVDAGLNNSDLATGAARVAIQAQPFGQSFTVPLTFAAFDLYNAAPDTDDLDFSWKGVKNVPDYLSDKGSDMWNVAKDHTYDYVGQQTDRLRDVMNFVNSLGGGDSDYWKFKLKTGGESLPKAQGGIFIGGPALTTSVSKAIGAPGSNIPYGFPVPDRELRNNIKDPSSAKTNEEHLQLSNQANLDEAYNFAHQWMSSPRYKEMLNKSGGTDWWTTSYDIAEERINNLNKIQSAPLYIEDDPDQRYTKKQLSGVAGYSKNESGNIYVKPFYGSNYSTLYDHEMSHSIDRPIANSLPKDFIKFWGRGASSEPRLIPSNDVDLITNLIDHTIPQDHTVSFWDSYGDTPEEGTRNYYGTPTEVRARLNEIRRKLYDKGVDVFNNEITPDNYNKVLNNKAVEELRAIYSDEDILRLLNTISSVNDNAGTMPYAKLGGQLPKAQFGPPSEFITGFDPNNPFELPDFSEMGKTSYINPDTGMPYAPGPRADAAANEGNPIELDEVVVTAPAGVGLQPKGLAPIPIEMPEMQLAPINLEQYKTASTDVASMGEPKVTRKRSVGNALKQAETFIKDNPYMQAYGDVSNFAVMGANLANEFFAEKEYNDYRNKLRNATNADKIYNAVVDPINQRGTFDVNTGLAEPDNLVDYYMQGKYGREMYKTGGDFSPHMMYDPKTGKGYKANVLADHIRMADMGYLHKDEMGYGGELEVDNDTLAALIAAGADIEML